MKWPDARLLDLFGISLPIVQAPMANFSTTEMAIAAAEAGALGSLPFASLSVEQMRAALSQFRAATKRSVNVNFFCHALPEPQPEREAVWRARLRPYYLELGLDPDAVTSATPRRPFDDAACEVVEEFRPEVVSFHFGLPSAPLLARVRATGVKVMASATTVAEARHLFEQGCDAVIAMGQEAGGHRGNFLTHDMARQVGTFALVPQIADAVDVPVIAAGGICNGRGIAASFALGASAAQIGTAYLYCPEAKVTTAHRKALEGAADDSTAITNLLTGRPARGIVNRLMRELGPLSSEAPDFPNANVALAPLKAKAEGEGRGDFSNLWAGQAAALAAQSLPARELTLKLARDAQEILRQLAV